MDHVGDKIRRLREARGLSQLKLTKQAGLPQSYISRLENGELGATAHALERIAGALGVGAGEVGVRGEDARSASG